MQQNTKQALALLSLLVSGVALAGAPPIIPFEEGERFNLSLSSLNFNRIFVEGEKITQLSYPSGAFVVDKSDSEEQGAASDSVYLKPMVDTPLTVFFETDKKHHFSITVNSDDSYGKTLRLAIRHDAKREYVKADTRDLSDVDEAMLAMQEGRVPAAFTSKPVVKRAFYVKKDIQVSLEKEFVGSHLTGYVYRLENKAKNPVELSTSLFENQKAESLSLSETTLNPKQVAYLYGLYPNEG